jgi:DNA-binding transcriptional LysR family regulator
MMRSVDSRNAAKPSGVLRMTAPHDFAITVLPELLAQFALRYPEVAFDTRLTGARVDLVAERFDLAIRIAATRLPDSGLTVRKLGNAPTSFYAVPAYLARRGHPKAMWSTEHDWIVHRAVVDHWKLSTAGIAAPATLAA